MRIWLFLLMVVHVTACTAREESCKSFTGKYPEIILNEDEDFRGSQDVIARGRGIVAACYRRHPIQPEGGAINFNKAVKTNDGTVYLTYNIQLWNDVGLAFKIGREGDVVEGYQYSTYGGT